MVIEPHIMSYSAATSDIPTSFYFGWDKGLIYEGQKERLEKLILDNENNPKSWAYYSILLIQLLNGSRIGEACAAAVAYSENAEREQRVRVEKRKKEVFRLMIIPDIIRKNPNIKGRFKRFNDNSKSLKNNLSRFSTRNLEFNTHAQRYAFISFMADKLAPQEIAKLTGQKTMDMILHYTQSNRAEALLRDLIK